MSPEDYEKHICKRLPEADYIPFQEVSLPGWSPKIAKCHENVDAWVAANPGTIAVRGWVTYIDFGFKVRLTAHSVVRDASGRLFDITPLSDERVRASMRFVPHVGDEREFSSFKKITQFIDCVN